jgi:hypothetical protein
LASGQLNVGEDRGKLVLGFGRKLTVLAKLTVKEKGRELASGKVYFARDKAYVGTELICHGENVIKMWLNPSSSGNGPTKSIATVRNLSEFGSGCTGSAGRIKGDLERWQMSQLGMASGSLGKT